ncbi:nuclear transport factor 2 family protein [Nocardioides sp. YIM 152315]|uniref:nuclear transport factor 2 family protein n=1 Tax=Nocardioides sp. YIM 152315 TaxID=3031760 RepID=UPI0023DC0F38|nr:nuclear transport factor 2 family protein [Nocardioides sp. YIM 152315]MDF1604658.1 nuclear transport factor 2 family protein [Nocardioides sp. YIM 152315]
MTAGLDPADRLAVTELAHRYAAGVDDLDPDAVADLFTPDAVLVAPDPPRHLDPVTEHHGRDGVRAALAALAPFRRTVHEVTGVVVDAVAADTATGRVTGVAHHYLERADGLTDIRWRVRYDDRYVRTERGWRIARRAVTVLALETVPVRQARGHEPPEGAADG